MGRILLEILIYLTPASMVQNNLEQRTVRRNNPRVFRSCASQLVSAGRLATVEEQATVSLRKAHLKLMPNSVFPLAILTLSISHTIHSPSVSTVKQV